MRAIFVQRLTKPWLCTLAALLPLLVALYPAPPAYGAESRCMDTADQRLDKMKSWSGLRRWFERYEDCDDGHLGEGISDYVVVSLARRWQDLPRLQRQMKRNSRFEAFVLRHIDATTDTGDLEAVVENATRRCPKHSAPLCSSIASAAREALAEIDANP